MLESGCVAEEHDLDVVRASQLQHAVQDVDSNRHVGRLTPAHYECSVPPITHFQRPMSASPKARKL